MDLKDLYRDVIVDHNRHPRNFGKLDPADAHADGYNPLCGDRLTIYVNLDGERIRRRNSRAAAARFRSRRRRCSPKPSRASRAREVQELFDDVHALLTQHDANVDPASSASSPRSRACANSRRA